MSATSVFLTGRVNGSGTETAGSGGRLEGAGGRSQSEPEMTSKGTPDRKGRVGAQWSEALESFVFDPKDAGQE